MIHTECERFNSWAANGNRHKVHIAWAMAKVPVKLR